MDEAIEAVNSLVAGQLSEIYTTLPGVIVSFDGTIAVVRPTIDKQLANGKVLPAPQIVQVPVCWPVGDVKGAQALITVPLKPGDPVKLSFSARSLENWLSGQDGPPEDPRQFDLSDAFATPVMRPGVAVADTENVSIQYGPGSMKIAPDGTLTIHVPRKRVIAEETVFDSKVTVNGLLTYTQGMNGSGGSGSATISINGDVDFSGGALTHNGANVGNTHVHDLNDGPPH